MLPELEEAARDWQRVTDYLVSLVRAVDNDKWSEPSGYPDWSNKDLLAHIAAGYVVRIGRLEAVVNDADPPAPVDIDATNALNTSVRKDVSVEDLISELLETRLRVLALMEDLQPEHLTAEIERAGPPPYKEPAIDFLSKDLSSHDLQHASDLIRSTGVSVEPLDLAE
jgi:hypothetical protein